jgi:hypothetical protein
VCVCVCVLYDGRWKKNTASIAQQLPPTSTRAARTQEEMEADDQPHEWDLVDAAEDTDDEAGESGGGGGGPPPPAAGADLAQYGVAVVRAFDDVGRRHWNERLFRAMDDFPEYRLRGPTVQRVLGGFGALGNPSSFHHPEVRVFRRMRKKLLLRPVMAAFARQTFGEGRCDEVRMESLFDRLCVRCEDFHRPVAEAWHRDIYGAAAYKLRPLPHTLPGGAADLLFGGWTNLDHREQRFVGLLSTHREAVTRGQSGFAEFSKADVQKFRFNERLLQQADRRFGHTLHTDAKGHVRVPPGHAILFQQELVHSVVSGPQPETPALRVFHGVRLTTETVPLFDVAAAIDNGGVPRIPSGQIPPMFSSNHYQFFASHERYRRWGEQTFRRECLFERRTRTNAVYYTPGSRGDRNRAANAGRYMPSLSEMGLWDERFAYSDAEVRAMHPQRLFAAAS